MKNLFSSIATMCCVIIGIMACNETDLVNSEIKKIDQREFLKQNVSFTDARIRSVSGSEFVKELVFTNFSSENHLPNSLIFDGTTFFDDGSYNDLEAGDGIYASAAKFIHTEYLPFYREAQVRSVMEVIVVDKKFLHKNRINEIEYSKPKIPGTTELRGLVVAIECDIEFGTCGCNADLWGWCDCCCVTLKNCKAKISWEFGN